MKKFLGLVLCAAVTVAAAFAGTPTTVISEDDFYNNNWIKGNWTLEIAIEADGESEVESINLDIQGNKADSLVIAETDGEAEEMTLGDVVAILYAIPASMGLDDDTIALYQMYGMLSIDGDTNYRIDSTKTVVEMKFSLSMLGESLTMRVSMKK